MEAILNILSANAAWLNIVWWVTIGLMVVLFLMSVIAPYGKITKIFPLTIMFHPKENLDLDLQSVGYAMMHTTWLARISHYTIFIDAFFWFIVFNYFSPVLGAAVLGLMIYQAAMIGERAFTVSFTVLGILFFGLSLWMGFAIGWNSAWLIAIAVLMISGVVRLIGHSSEPAPPMMLDDTDRFVKVNAKTFNWKIVVMPVYGYVAEFASGLPNRLFTVQVNYLYQALLRFQPSKTLSWSRVNEKARKIFRSGYLTDERLGEYYQIVSGREKNVSGQGG